MYPNDPTAVALFMNGGFEIVRKTPDQILAMRRIVFDLDKQPRSRSGIVRTRWHPAPEDGTGWETEATGFRHNGGEAGWVRYQHINPWAPSEGQVYFIVDHVGYNNRGDGFNNPFPPDAASADLVGKSNRWVSDLIVDCTIEIPSAESEVILELNKGPVRVQAIFAKGQCQLVRYVSEGGQETRIEMGSHATKITDKGTYALKFANVDSRLTVWVDKKVIPFSPEQCDCPVPSPKVTLMPTERDRLQPARIGARGDVKVSKVSLWRDLHYNSAWNSQPDRTRRQPLEPVFVPSKPIKGEDGNVLELQTYYIQPGHYLMFGDNTNSSKDGRSWGLVPHRLMLGRAVVVYWPLSRLGVIE
jgi:signal peptidase I